MVRPVFTTNSLESAVGVSVLEWTNNWASPALLRCRSADGPVVPMPTLPVPLGMSARCSLAPVVMSVPTLLNVSVSVIVSPSTFTYADSVAVDVPPPNDRNGRTSVISLASITAVVISSISTSASTTLSVGYVGATPGNPCVPFIIESSGVESITTRSILVLLPVIGSNADVAPPAKVLA